MKLLGDLRHLVAENLEKILKKIEISQAKESKDSRERERECLSGYQTLRASKSWSKVDTHATTEDLTQLAALRPFRRITTPKKNGSPRHSNRMASRRKEKRSATPCSVSRCSPEWAHMAAPTLVGKTPSSLKHFQANSSTNPDGLTEVFDVCPNPPGEGSRNDGRKVAP